MPDEKNLDSNQIELSLELVRLSQVRVREYGVRLDNELSRQVAEMAIMALPEDLSLLLDETATMSQSNVLSAAVGVNDIVVNGRQIDVRPLLQDETVSIDRVLIGSPYLAQGSLVVRLDQSRPGVGSLVGYVTPNAWLKAEEAQKGSEHVTIKVTVSADFDLAATLTAISERPIIKLPSISRIGDVKAEVGELVNNRENLISARQKQIFAYLSTNWSEELLAIVESVPMKLSNARLQCVLSDAALWNGKVERLVEKLAPGFPDLGRDVLKARVLSAGERHGAQLGAPRYRRALLAELVALDLKAKNAKSPLLSSLAKAQALAEKVLSGTAAVDAVKNVIGNQMAVDLAVAIQKQRGKASISGLMAATAEELGLAYGQLALSPAFATHSSGEESGLESVNEALALIEASQRAENAKTVEIDLAAF
ncbi:MAG: hypothetical protein JSS86_03865 [Cyanobacteria bacterium SZAS LIN-2]|nr:hypothetical protein [Cyanobacteria bacterium SZAS LIN-2]